MAAITSYPPTAAAGGSFWGTTGTVPKAETPTDINMEYGAGELSVVITHAVPGTLITPVSCRLQRGYYLYNGAETRRITEVRGPSYGAVSIEVIIERAFSGGAFAAAQAYVVEPCFQSISIACLAGTITIEGSTFPAGAVFTLNRENMSNDILVRPVSYDATLGTAEISVTP